MVKKSALRILVYIVGGALLCWGTWVTNAPIHNKAEIMENRIAIEKNESKFLTKIEGVEGQLKIHYGLLKEIRDEQKRILRESK